VLNALRSASSNYQVFNSHRENLTVRRVPVLFSGVFPRYPELGPLGVEPIQTRNVTAVDLRD